MSPTEVRAPRPFLCFSNPNDAGQSVWQPYTTKGKEYLVLDADSHEVQYGLRNRACKFWSKILPQMKDLERSKFNSSHPGQIGRHFTDDIFRCIFVNEKFCILINISLKFIPKGQRKNIPGLVQIMAWCRIGDNPLSEPMLIQFIDAYIGGYEVNGNVALVVITGATTLVPTNIVTS